MSRKSALPASVLAASASRLHFHRPLVALADFSTEVLQHGALRTLANGSATGLLSPRRPRLLVVDERTAGDRSARVKTAQRASNWRAAQREGAAIKASHMLLATAARLAKAREKRKNSCRFGVHSENLGYVYFLY